MKGGEPNERPRRAVGESDLLYARLPQFRARVEQTLCLIERAARRGVIAVSFSGGKDSTVMLDLIRIIRPDVKAVCFDSGAELASTREICEYYGALRIEPMISVVEIWKQMGYGGHERLDEKANINLQRVLIDEPAERALAMLNADVSAIGLRADESPSRRKSAKYHGPIYRTVSGFVRFCPLLDWTTDDIWAYIALRNLRYNSAYDRMAEMNIPREFRRISTLLDGKAATVGRYVYLKRCEPELFNRLAADFPKLRAYA